MIKKTLFCIILGWLVFFANACCPATKETQPFTSKKRTGELLTIHTSISPKIPFKMDESRIVFFSDLHRGMGEKDVFKNNKELFEQILRYYNEKRFILVLIGDIEEGWGFQRDNIPLILNWHRKEFEIEKEFMRENRLYRIYGNHDDFYRGNCLCTDCRHFTKIYPAVIFRDETNKFNMLITHGCQGHGLHDAGDDLAAWGVYVKYNWFLEIFSKKVKTKKELTEKMDKIYNEFKKHEEYVYDWARSQKDQHGKRKYNILIAGHTHIPVFESSPLFDYMLELIKSDIKEKRFIFFNDIFKDRPESDSFELPTSLKEKMVGSILKYKSKELQLDSAKAEPKDPFYFNTGCGFLSEIPCVEINNGKIHLKFIQGFEGGLPVYHEAPGSPVELKKFL